MDRALARPLTWLLAAALVASLAALPVSRAQARDLVETDTSIDLADDEPELGDTITITALVERLDDETGDVPGQVTFVAGTAEAGPFGTTLGQAPLTGGEANLDYTVDEDTLPPGTTDSFYVVATYAGNATFEASTSDPVLVLITTTEPTDPVPTSIEVTGPDTADWAVETTLTATVRPSSAAGTVAFTVDGDPAGSVEVDGGSAALPYAFEDDGDRTVVASFEPDDVDQYLPSTSAGRVVTVAGFVSPYMWNPVFDLGQGCRPTPSAVGPDRRIVNPFTMIFTLDFPTFTPLFTIEPFFGLFHGFALDFEACLLGSVFGGAFGHRAETVPVDCVPTETGYQCRLELPGPPSSMTIEPSVPVPAELAGQDIAVSTTLTQIDPDGIESTLLDETRNVDVPRRTTLSAKLAPVKNGVTSVRRGAAVAYRLDVQNMGIVTADKVRACVSVGKGASIKTARSATVKGRQACWTLPSLASTKSQARTLTVIAPKRAGQLKLTGAVTPKKSQADPVRLTAALPVT